MHLQSHLIPTAELYGVGVLGIRENDLVFSAAKLFFAYGLGNGLTFPMAVGATAVLMAERPTPASVFQRLRQHQPTIFYGVPTLYAALLASPEMLKRGEVAPLRVCTSAVLGWPPSSAFMASSRSQPASPRGFSMSRKARSVAVARSWARTKSLSR